jgi:fatty acid desaturase
MALRNYSLLGPDSTRAVASGLAAAEWYHSDVPRKVMKDLMQRRDGPALRDTAILYGSMIVLAGMGIALWPTWWSAPFWLAYGVLYGSASDSRWHECGHGTAFKTPWMNTVVYNIACFMIVRNPPVFARVVGNFFGIFDGYAGWSRMILNATGRLHPEEATFIPDSEKPRVITVARIWMAIYAATFVMAIWMGSILPFMVIGLPRLYGAWQHVMVGLLQHGGLADNVTDHRLNSRTVLMGPINRFLYWNMNYHIEHHMFPMVPYHALPRLHALIKNDLPAPSPGVIAAYREMWPVLRRQLRNENACLQRVLPPTARPYRDDFHTAGLGAAE